MSDDQETEQFDMEAILREELAKKTVCDEIALNSMQGNAYYIAMVNTDHSKCIYELPGYNHEDIRDIAVELFGSFVGFLTEHFENPNVVIGYMAKNYMELDIAKDEGEDE